MPTRDDNGTTANQTPTSSAIPSNQDRVSGMFSTPTRPTGGSPITASHGGLHSRDLGSTDRIRDQQVIALPSSAQPTTSPILSSPSSTTSSPAAEVSISDGQNRQPERAVPVELNSVVQTPPLPAQQVEEATTVAPATEVNSNADDVPPPPAGVYLAGSNEAKNMIDKPTVIEALPEDELSPFNLEPAAVDTSKDDLRVIVDKSGQPAMEDSAINKDTPWKKKTHYAQSRSQSEYGSSLPHSSIKEDISHNAGGGRIVEEYGSHPYKRFTSILLTVAVIMVVIGSLVQGAYSGWLEQLPIPKAVPYAIQTALSRFGLPPSTALILNQTADAMDHMGTIKHYLIINSNALGESVSGTISGTSSADMQFVLLESRFVYQTSAAQTELTLDVNKNAADLYLNANQSASSPSLNLTPINDQWLRLALNPNLSNGGRTLPGEQALSSIRNRHLADVRTEMINDFATNASLLSDHDFSTTHYVLEYNLPKDKLVSYISQIMNEFNQSKVRETMTQGELEAYMVDVSEALPDFMTVQMLINRQTHLIETVTINGQLLVEGKAHTVQLAYTPTYQTTEFTAVPAPAASESSATVVWDSLLRHPLLRGLTVILQ